jgi:hypothetical protein
LAPLTGEERKPLREVCRAGRDAVDAGITRLELSLLSAWGGGQESTSWAGAPLGAVRLPALRHLNLYQYSGWAQHGAAHMRGAARLVAAHAASLRTLRLYFCITPQSEYHHELAALEGGLLESVLLAAPLSALERLDLGVYLYCTPADEARCMAALRPLERLSLPLLTRLSLSADGATGQGVRWLEGTHLPALRHLEVDDYSDRRPVKDCVAAITALRWSALEALALGGFASESGGMPALSAVLAPTLRRLTVGTWSFGTEGCAEEWPQLRSLEVVYGRMLAEQLGPVRLPRLERLAVRRGDSLRGFAARRAALPALCVVERKRCFCGNNDCVVVGGNHSKTVELLAELRAAWPGLEVRRFKEDDWTQA